MSMHPPAAPVRPATVVVPTRDRPEALRRCLAALARQEPAVEVVVVDDRSAPAAAATIRAAAEAARATVVSGDGRGPAAARNLGARAAARDVVLFCDDDCEPAPEWAAALASACPVGGSAAGETVSAEPADLFATASQLLTSELQRSSLQADGSLGFAPTSNLAVDRRLACRVPFDESFARAAGEDREWCARAAAANAAPRYVPAAVVRHRQELNGMGGFLRQQVRYGRGAATLRGVQRLAGPAQRLRLVRAGLAQGPWVGALVVLAQVAVAWGYALERLSRRPPPGGLR
jgi:glycosyltransferase involved in cell wall biosynthesis